MIEVSRVTHRKACGIKALKNELEASGIGLPPLALSWKVR
jgi:hypothetical protein